MNIEYRNLRKAAKLNQLMSGRIFRLKDGKICMKCCGRSVVGTTEAVDLNTGEVFWINDRVEVEIVVQVGKWEVEGV